MNWQMCLTHAAALIDKCGWIKEREGDPVEGFCAVGAISLASRGDVDLFNAACGMVARVASRQVGGLDTSEPNNTVTKWNDKVASSKEQVVELLRSVAQEAAATRPCACPQCELGSTMIYQGPAFVQEAVARQMDKTIAEMLEAGPLASKRKVASVTTELVSMV